jgi:8-oxo-dGTP pyrophosphatase MutT (NUDIX family)
MGGLLQANEILGREYPELVGQWRAIEGRKYNPIPNATALGLPSIRKANFSETHYANWPSFARYTAVGVRSLALNDGFSTPNRDVVSMMMDGLTGFDYFNGQKDTVMSCRANLGYPSGSSLNHELVKRMQSGLYVARTMIISPGDNGQVLVMCRPRAAGDKHGGMMEIPGGIVEENVLRRSVYGDGTLELAVNEAIATGEREMEEEVGELTPSLATRKGLAMSLVAKGNKVLLDVAELSVVEQGTMFQLVAMANSRRNRSLDDAGSWLVYEYPSRVRSNDFLPTTAFMMRNMLDGQSPRVINGWNGATVFMPYDMASVATRGRTVFEMGWGLTRAEMPSVRR